MARPFRSEMAELNATVEWAGSADISSLVEAVSRSRSAPLVAVGSGGSLSAASHLARMHRRHFGQVASALSPFAYASDPIAHDAHHWIISAGGSNVDVLSAVNKSIAGEPAAINVLTMKERSRLATISAEHPAVNFHRAAIPSKKDGFLATNSLLGFCLLLTKAYGVAAGGAYDWQNFGERLLDAVDRDSAYQLRWRNDVRQLSAVEHLIVLHDLDTDLGAIDLESKLTEAAIKNVQLADYRHFAHGRHHWLAKNGENSGVLLFQSSGSKRLAERTRKLLPASVPTAVIDVDAEGDLAELTSLVAAYVATDEFGQARGIDPGQPGVPDFGRKLYGLRLPVRTARPLMEVAIRRKSRVAAPHLDSSNWTGAYRQVVQCQRAATFGAVVFDFDGTLVDTRDRFEPVRPEVAEQLVRLVTGGIKVAIATGRGRSAGEALRSALPRETWSAVTVGYYNGAAVHMLDEQEAPGRIGKMSKQLERAQSVLASRLGGMSGFSLDARPHQLTVTFGSAGSEERTWNWIQEVLDVSNVNDLRVVRSSHSIDVLDRATSKVEAVSHLSAAVMSGNLDVLRIGDRGGWPGNDFELLADPFGLSVDQVSGDPSGCWNLAPEGLSGVRALLHYLEAMRIEGSCIRLCGEPW